MDDEKFVNFFVGAIIVGLVVSQILIFGFEQEARQNWGRMIPAAVIGGFLFTFALEAFVVGIAFFRSSITDNDAGLLILSTALIFLGFFVPCFWVKKIVFENIGAFGVNSNNIYAITTAGTLVHAFIWALIGAGVGILILFIRSIFKKM